MAISGELTINLAALEKNYKILDGLSAKPCVTGACVKADAYGLGAREVVSTLNNAGAKHFFVATLEEGVQLRAHVKEAQIYILNGFFGNKCRVYYEYSLIPVLNSLAEIESYNNWAHEMDMKLPAVIHFDTGMNRLGLSASEARILSEDLSVLDGIELRYIMSHFSSSEEKANPVNQEQYKKFLNISAHFKGVKVSLCNSAGIFLSSDYHLDLTRPGIALYGGALNSEMQKMVKPVVSLSVPVLQVRSVKKGNKAGYNGSYEFINDTKIATISVGYADGLFRSLGNKGEFYWQGCELPIRGRISMDLVICDLSRLPENLYPVSGDMVEVIGKNQTIEDIAAKARTIPYEILTSLGSRYKRSYIS